MNTFRTLLIAALALLPLIGGPAVADHHKKGEEKGKKTAKLGEKAPDFTLKNLDGEKVSLSDHTSKDQIVILEWMNPDCPFCTRVHKSGLVSDMLEKVDKLTDGNFVHIEINSTHYMGPEKTRKYLEKHGVSSTALMDKSGKVGHMYDAKTTPHMYVIDQDGVLRYRGAFDNSPKGKKSPSERENYVIKAVKHIVNGNDVSPQKVKPWGCSVKYK